METESSSFSNPMSNEANKKKIHYHSPKFVCFGTVTKLTSGQTGSVADGQSGMGMTSDRRLKENIVKIGKHWLGFGLYLFDYKLRYKTAATSGKKFGVMADEVEKVMPNAVSVHPDGYKMVNYAMLGISLNNH